MPINPPLITGAVIAAAPELTGPDWIRTAGVVGVAVTTWALTPGNLILNGVTGGVSLVGQVPSGKMVVPPTPDQVWASSVAHGIAGLISPSMARGIGVGVGTAFSAAAFYLAVSAGVGLGADISKVTIVNHATLVASFAATFAAFGMTGVNIAKLSSAYGIGIANQMLLGVGFGAVAPIVLLPVPLAGASVGVQVY